MNNPYSIQNAFRACFNNRICIMPRSDCYIKKQLSIGRLLIGIFLFCIGAGCLIKWYVANYFITENSIQLIVYAWMLFQGVYFLSSSRNHAELPNRKKFYTNFIAIIITYFLFSVICVLWSKLLIWRLNNPAPFHLSGLFAAFPMNNISWLSDKCSASLTKWFQIIYSTGYILPLLFPVWASFISRRYETAWRYFLSGHILQVFLITPFYLLFQVQEVWAVNGIPDAMMRTFSNEAEKNFAVSWCFPSMHTSVVAASLLIAIQEPYRLVKWCWCAYCIAVIVSTVWLPIHWVIDVMFGVIIGYIAVRWADRIIAGFWFQKIILCTNNCYERSPVH